MILALFLLGVSVSFTLAYWFSVIFCGAPQAYLWIGLVLWFLTGSYVYFGSFSRPIVKLRRLVWNCGIKLWWYRLWIRKNEFHRSLRIDVEAVLAMSDKQQKEYILDLLRRREVAHNRDMLRSSRENGTDTFGE